MKRFLIGLLSLFVTAQAHAQSVPYFPQTLPSGTVVGRLTTGPGPAEAISTSRLLAFLTAGVYTPGSVLYAGSNGYLSQDNATFFWDSTNKRLGLGTVTPGYLLHLYNSAGAAELTLESASGSTALNILNRTYSTTAANGLKIYQDTAGVARFGTTGTNVFSIGGTYVGISGSSSGLISIIPQAASGTYNLNLPITAGTAGQALTSQGGSATAMTWGTAFLGTTTNDAAATGFIGEALESTVLVGSAVSLTSTTAANLATLSLTAGDWNVCGTVLFTNNASTTTTLQQAAFFTTTATLPTAPAGGWAESGGSTLTGPSNSLTVGCHRVSVAAPTSYFLVVRATFAVSTKAVYGYAVARRMR